MWNRLRQRWNVNVIVLWKNKLNPQEPRPGRKEKQGKTTGALAQENAPDLGERAQIEVAVLLQDHEEGTSL